MIAWLRRGAGLCPGLAEAGASAGGIPPAVGEGRGLPSRGCLPRPAGPAQRSRLVEVARAAAVRAGLVAEHAGRPGAQGAVAWFAAAIAHLAVPALLLLAPPALAADAAAGARKADDERCIECHGADGQGLGNSAGSEGRFPRLAGQFPDYLLKQLADFRSGARRHDTMNLMARTVEPADLADIVAWFATLGPMRGEGGGAGAAGEALFRDGDPARGLPACLSCHGAQGRGIAGSGAPVIGAQEWRYLDKQLRDWRSGERNNSAGGVMNRIAAALKDGDIRALADYLAAQPGRAE